MNPLRVAVIGAGYWGPNLVRNLSEAPGAEPVAVADLLEERLERVRKRFPALRVTTDHRALFADPAVEAVCLATPVGTHRALAEEAFAAGKHVFVEKPLAGTVADAEAILRAAERAGGPSWWATPSCTTRPSSLCARCSPLARWATSTTWTASA